MAYNSDYSNRNTYPDNRRRQNYYRDETPAFTDVDQPLSKEYRDKAKLYLTDGFAHSAARKFKDAKTTSHQLRKVLSQAKQAVVVMDSGEDKFDEARNLLYMLVPMAAYNAGRMPALKPLYIFLKANINEKSVKSPEDILVFDNLITSIVAYHKYEEEQGKKKTGRRL